MRYLSPEIVDFLVKKLDISPQTVKNNVTKLSTKHPQATPNARAHIFALSNKVKVWQKLDKEDKASMPPIDVVREKVKVTQKLPRIKAKEEILFIYESNDHFVDGHIAELHKAFNCGCYTAVFILFRKIVENLIVDILKAKYPPKTSKANLELYYDTVQKRYKDFSVILKNLLSKKDQFGTDNRAVERLYNLALPLKEDANNKTHSWFHLVENKKELENMQMKSIIQLIIILEKSVGLKA